jgi:hypothetical protein
MRIYYFPVLTCLLMGLSACDQLNPPREAKPPEQPEQQLTITYGGFIQDGPEDQLLDGTCSPDADRTTIECDIHNGLAGWSITEITLQVIRPPYDETNHKYYRERVEIEPFQTAHIVIRLGMELPPDDQLKKHGRPIGKPMSHWSWLVVGAKGKPLKTQAIVNP